MYNYSRHITRLLAYERVQTITHQQCSIFSYMQSKPTECLGKFVVTTVAKTLMLPLGWSSTVVLIGHRFCGADPQGTHIERLWVDLGVQFVRQQRTFFIRLEDLHLLDSTDPCHLWLRQFLFFDQLNIDCVQFQNDWNHHPVSKQGHDQSPLVCNPLICAAKF